MKTYLGNLAPLPGTNATAHPIDVVFHLGRNRRFGGWADSEWSGLHHSMFVALLYLRSYGYEGLHNALLHDAHEFVTGDIPSPVKALLGKEQVQALENHVDGVIQHSLMVSGPSDADRSKVKVCDLAALIIEAYYFGSRSANFEHIGETTWKTTTDGQRCNIALAIRRSCPEVYKAMLNSNVYNPARWNEKLGRYITNDTLVA